MWYQTNLRTDKSESLGFRANESETIRWSHWIEPREGTVLSDPSQRDMDSSAGSIEEIKHSEFLDLCDGIRGEKVFILDIFVLTFLLFF